MITKSELVEALNDLIRSGNLLVFDPSRSALFHHEDITGVCLNGPDVQITLSSPPRKQFDIREHIEITIADQPNGGYWLYTHGMTQFEKPDLEIVQVPGLFITQAANLLNCIAEYLAEGAEIEPGHRMNIPQLPIDILFLTGDAEEGENRRLRLVTTAVPRCPICAANEHGHEHGTD